MDVKQLSTEEMNNIIEPVENEIVYNTDDEKYYIWKNEWININPDANINLNLYDMNKQIMSQIPDFTKEQMDESISTLNEWVNKTKSKYFMMLCKDISYYTLFNRTKSAMDDNFGKCFKDCVNSLGPIKSIDFNEDKTALEIWFSYEDDVYCMYLFPYDSGVVNFRG